MRKLCGAISAVLLLSQFAEAHHGPGLRGYDNARSVVIAGVIVECVQCTSGDDHGVLYVLVDFVVWDVTLPSSAQFKKAKASVKKLKKDAAVKVTGFPNKSKATAMYADEIIVNGRLLGTGLAGNR
jgi:hypothetical protein